MGSSSKASKTELKRGTKFRLGKEPDGLEVLGRNLILESGEFFGQFGGQYVKAGRKELADLDHHAPHAHGHDSKIGGDATVAAAASAARKPFQPNAGKEDIPKAQSKGELKEEGGQIEVPGAQMPVLRLGAHDWQFYHPANRRPVRTAV